jgi:hypothetical protein
MRRSRITGKLFAVVAGGTSLNASLPSGFETPYWT